MHSPVGRTEEVKPIADGEQSGGMFRQIERETGKWVHIVSSTILFGTGIGSAFCLLMANRSKEVPSIYFATCTVVIADFLFTSPAAVVQLLTGLWLLRLTGYSLSDSWVKWGLALYFFAGACWLPVVWMQVEMRDMARAALETEKPLPERYWRRDKWWTVLGSLAACQNRFVRSHWRRNGDDRPRALSAGRSAPLFDATRVTTAQGAARNKASRADVGANLFPNSSDRRCGATLARSTPAAR
jgi:uncharacterized membrane protein